jgi:hypothetical protein
MLDALPTLKSNTGSDPLPDLGKARLVTVLAVSHIPVDPTFQHCAWKIIRCGMHWMLKVTLIRPSHGTHCIALHPPTSQARPAAFVCHMFAAVQVQFLNAIDQSGLTAQSVATFRITGPSSQRKPVRDVRVSNNACYLCVCRTCSTFVGHVCLPQGMHDRWHRHYQSLRTS